MARRKKIVPQATSDVPLPAPVRFFPVSDGIKMRDGAIAWIKPADAQGALAAIGTARQLGHRVYVEVDNGVLSFMAD